MLGCCSFKKLHLQCCNYSCPGGKAWQGQAGIACWCRRTNRSCCCLQCTAAKVLRTRDIFVICNVLYRNPCRWSTTGIQQVTFINVLQLMAMTLVMRNNAWQKLSHIQHLEDRHVSATNTNVRFLLPAQCRCVWKIICILRMSQHQLIVQNTFLHVIKVVLCIACPL